MKNANGSVFTFALIALAFFCLCMLLLPLLLLLLLQLQSENKQNLAKLKTQPKMYTKCCTRNSLLKYYVGTCGSYKRNNNS